MKLITTVSLLLLLLDRSANTECLCTGSAIKGDYNPPEIVSVFDSVGNPLLTACGYTDVWDENDTTIYASEFEVIDCKRDSTVLWFGAFNPCLVKSYDNSIWILEMHVLPFGDNWSYIKVPIKEYWIGNDTSLLLRRETRIAPPKLTGKQVESTLEEFRKRKEVGSAGPDYELLLGKILALALIGNEEILEELSDLRNTLHLDGESGLIFKHNLEILKTYQALDSARIPAH